MYNSALGLREPSLEQEPLAGLRPQAPARPLSVLSENSALRWRHGERLSDVIEEACRRYGERVAVSVESAEISYRELDARANQMARLFRARGVKPGDRVAVLLDRGIEAYVALLAILKAGAAYVPLDANHPSDRIRFIVSDAGATLAVTHLRLADRLSDCGTPTLVLDGTRAEVGDVRAMRRLASGSGTTARSATSSTRPARPATRRASRSPIRASAISCESRPRVTASSPPIASTRECLPPSTSRSRRSGCRSLRGRRSFRTPARQACSAKNSPTSSSLATLHASAVSRRCSPRSSASCRNCASC